MKKHQLVEEIIGINNTFDFTKRIVTTNEGLEIKIYFNPFLVDSLKVSRLMTSIIKIKDEIKQHTFKDTLLNEFISESMTFTTDIPEITDALFNGDVVIIIDEIEEMVYMETKSYPSRSISEPDSEKVVRGSRDGFTENFAINIGLVRRRIKDGDLVMKLYEIGEVSKTRVVLLYLKDVIKKEVLEDITNKLNNLKVKELTMSDKALEELLVDNTYSPYPLVKYTERPDTLAIHLYQGMFGLIVDTSPSAILAPVTIFDHLQHAEEYRQTVVAGSYLRIVRLIGIILSFFIIPLWFSLTFINNPPSYLDFIMPKDISTNNLFIQILIVEIGIELIRMASIHTPSALSTSMGLISGLIIGDLAISVGLFNEQVVILSALSSIGSYITPSYELSVANKIMKLMLLLFVYFLHIPGLIIGTLVILLYLTKLKSFKRPYLYPLIPFNLKDLTKQLFRIPYIKKEKTKKSNHWLDFLNLIILLKDNTLLD